MQSLLRLRGVAAYLEVVEEDNRLASGVLVKGAAIMHSALCTPLHSRGVGGAHRPLPHEVFKAIGENGLIAFCSLGGTEQARRGPVPAPGQHHVVAAACAPQ